MMVVTSFASSIAAEPNPTTDTATVTVSGLEPGAKVTLYQIVQPKSGTSFTGYEFVSQAREKLVGPNDLIEVKDASNNSLFVAAKDLDTDTDGLIDNKYTKDSVEYTVVDSTKVGKILYDMENPNQVSINRAVAETAYATTPYTKTVDNDKDYVQFDVKPGQYIGIITPGPGDNYSYNPVVLSAGYADVDKYRLIDPNESIDEDKKSYKYKNGHFTTADPTIDTYHLYDNCAWNKATGEAEFAADDSETGVEATDSYKKLYVKDGETTETQLLADNLDFPAYYTSYPDGTTAVPKRNKPGIVKNHEMDEENREISSAENLIKLPVIATDDKNCEIVDENDKLKYIKAIYSISEFEDAKAGKKFKLEGEKYVQDPAGTFSGQTVLDAMMTIDAKEALTVTRENGKYEFMASQGEEIRYTLAASVPQYPLNAKNKTFVVTDNLSDGLDFVEGSIEISFASNVDATTADNGSPNDTFTVTKASYDVVRVQDNTDSTLYHFYVYEPSGKIDDNGEVVDGKGTYYKDGDEYKLVTAATSTLAKDTVVYTYNEFAKAKEIAAGTQDNDNDFQVNFIYDNLPGGEGSKVAPVIRYKAVLLDTAIEGVVGNPNVAKVYYAKNTSDNKNWDTDSFEEPKGEDYNEWRDARKVYTYEIRFRKTNDKPEYITTQENPTHYVLKDYSTLTDALKAKVDALVKTDGKVLFETESEKNIAKTQAVVKLANGDETMRYITTVDPVTDRQAEGYNADVYESESKTIKLNPDFTTLKDAVFGLYSDSDCKNLVTEIKVNKDGVGFSTKVGNQNYWLKEITPPQHYSKNSDPILVTPTWTSATTYTTESTERKVYTPDITKAMDANGDGNKPAVKTQGTNNVVADASINSTTKLAEDQVGWLVGTSENSKFYENDVYNLSASGSWAYNEEGHKMTHTDGTVIKNVFRAYLETFTTTSTTGNATYYNNNGGTVSLNRINNTKTSELPSTGGIGTYLFTIAGVAIIATAAFMLIFRKKEGHNH